MESHIAEVTSYKQPPGEIIEDGEDTGKNQLQLIRQKHYKPIIFDCQAHRDVTVIAAQQESKI